MTFPATETKETTHEFEDLLSYRECPKTWHITCSDCAFSEYAPKGEAESCLEHHSRYHQDEINERTVCDERFIGTDRDNATVRLHRSEKISLTTSEYLPPYIAREVGAVLISLSDAVDEEHERSELRRRFEENQTRIAMMLDYDNTTQALACFTRIIQFHKPESRPPVAETAEEPPEDLTGFDRLGRLDELVEQRLSRTLSWEVLLHALERHWRDFRLPTQTPFITISVPQPTHGDSSLRGVFGPSISCDYFFDAWPPAEVRRRAQVLLHKPHMAIWRSFAGDRLTSELLWETRGVETNTIAAWCLAVGHDDKYYALERMAAEVLDANGVPRPRYHHQSSALPISPTSPDTRYSTYDELAKWIVLCAMANMATLRFVQINNDVETITRVTVEPSPVAPRRLKTSKIVPHEVSCLPPSRLLDLAGDLRQEAHLLRETHGALAVADDGTTLPDRLERIASNADRTEVAPALDSRSPVVSAFITSWLTNSRRWHVAHGADAADLSFLDVSDTCIEAEWSRALRAAQWSVNTALPLLLEQHTFLPQVPEALVFLEAAPLIIDGLSAKVAALAVDDAAELLAVQVRASGAGSSVAHSVRDALVFLALVASAARSAAFWAIARDGGHYGTVDRVNGNLVASWCPELPCEVPEGFDPNDEPRIVGHFSGIVASHAVSDIAPLLQSILGADHE